MHEDPRWVVAIDDDPQLERVREALLTTADGRFGTRASSERTGAGSEPMVVAAGVYDPRRDGREALLEGPVWTTVDAGQSGGDGRWWLDLRSATVGHERDGAHSLRFSSLARPGWMGLRLEGPGVTRPSVHALQRPGRGDGVEAGEAGDVSWMSTRSASCGGGIVAAAIDIWDDRARRLDRLVVFDADASRAPTPAGVVAAVQEAAAVGFDRLFQEHRAGWQARWDAADVAVDGAGDGLQAAVRFSLHHLIAAVAAGGEAAVGARGLSGRNYDGHVFWDAEVFTLPFLAATHPAASRAMLQYRFARLQQAHDAAARRGRAGARFPWESASEGVDVTPRFVRLGDGTIIPIRAGTHEEHIVADVAWACAEYLAWTGDEEFAAGAGRALLAETARYWASRVRFGADGVGHIYGVEGPDEYHDVVDDNAFTNVMARWNLRRAAASERRFGGPRADVEQWAGVADRLCDGLDAHAGRYEQFAGFFGLEPVLISEIASTPVAADMLLGRERTRAAQVLKQPDVLMLHHLVPDEVAAGSLAPNLDFYLPRTSHGSSLSPAICASLLARADRPDDAVDLFRIAARLDLDDLTGTTAGGVHLATMGGVWQALVHGFMGVRMGPRGLHVDPHLPTGWSAVTAHVTVRDTPVRVAVTDRTVELTADGNVDVQVGDAEPVEGGAGRLLFEHRDGTWRRST